jgi:AcrR family transcriptional regulator
VGEATLAPLPKGRHALSRAQVEQAQRIRLAVAMAEAMADRGYVGTPVAAVLHGAGISRETFYRLYDDKLGCFLDALDFVGAVLLADLGVALGDGGEPEVRAAQVLDRYLDTLGEHPAFARLFLVEVHAAGPEAMARRAALQARVVDALADLVGAQDRATRFSCEAFVAAVGSLVTLPIVTGDRDALEALRRPLHDHLRTLLAP